MDEDFILPVIIVCILIGLTVLFFWMKSRGKRSIIKSMKQAQEELKLTPFVGSHSQLDAVWYAVRGQVNGLTMKIFGGESRGILGGTVAKAASMDRTCVMIIVSLPEAIPFRFNIQRRLALSTPKFGTSYAEFDKVAEVKTEEEKKALTILNDEKLRAAIISFLKLAPNAFITSSEVMIKVSSDKQILHLAHEAVTIATMLGNQINPTK
jgi:hypothetical protein